MSHRSDCGIQVGWICTCGGFINDSKGATPKPTESEAGYVQQLPGGLCFKHGPYTEMGCPKWPDCASGEQPFKLATTKSENAPHPTAPNRTEQLESIVRELAETDCFAGTHELPDYMRDLIRRSRELQEKKA